MKQNIIKNAYISAFDIDDKKTWDDGINWLYKMCCKFKELVEKYK